VCLSSQEPLVFPQKDYTCNKQKDLCVREEGVPGGVKVGSVCPRCRDAMAGWARAASDAGNRWAAIAAVAAARRRADGKHGRRQAEEAEVTADGSGRGGNRDEKAEGAVQQNERPTRREYLRVCCPVSVIINLSLQAKLQSLCNSAKISPQSLGMAILGTHCCERAGNSF
jgi:hypothetical protein